ncbi:MAG: hypothetical protein E6R13_02620 [Spirochaetes bacterium]|nr:MAG: hypothetical protein E6R13_02620 [Spirochaetota bacterium]
MALNKKDLSVGTSHAGKSKELSKVAGFEVRVSNVTFDGSNNKRIIDFEGDGIITTWSGLSYLFTNGARYINNITGDVHYGSNIGDDFVLSTISTPLAIQPIDVVNVTEYTILHNANYPLVQVIDSTGLKRDCGVRHVSPTEILVSFLNPFTGKILLSVI